MLLHYFLPQPALREYVRLLQLIHLDFTGAPVVPVKAYWPRPENCLAFYPRDSETVTYTDTGLTSAKGRSALIGQPTVVTNRQVGRHCLVFQVVFQPGALFRLTGIPAYELTNTFVDAEAVFSAEIRRVNERLSSTDAYPVMIDIVESFLLYLVSRTQKERRPIDAVSLTLLNRSRAGLYRPPTVDELAQASCLSPKQFGRQSLERLGVGPKWYDRVIRFDQAVRHHLANPAKDWLTVALEAGYYDYQHLVRDFRAFTSLTPAQFAPVDQQAPERTFGLAES